MKPFYFLLFFICSIPVFAAAQTDSVTVKPDSLKKKSVQSVKDSGAVKDSMLLASDSAATSDSMQMKGMTDSIIAKPAADTLMKRETKSGAGKIFSGKEYLFYYLLFLFLLFGWFRRAFAKYFNDLFRVFFRTTLKQKQIREQLLQSPLPSVLMNCFFVLSVGLYVNFLLLHFQLFIVENFWLQYVYVMSALAFIYLIKFLGLKITGWLFHVQEATESYIFIVFIINKMLAIALLPFLALLAFTSGSVYNTSLNLSWIIAGLLFGYRFILSYGAVRNEIKFNPFHFILYVIGFEIVPLLLIYKLLLYIL
jgi:hypothetical protein